MKPLTSTGGEVVKSLEMRSKKSLTRVYALALEE
jgi:hypothetical protein